MKKFIQIVFLLSTTVSYSQSLLIDKTTACKFTLPWNCDDCTMNWSGDCKDSLPNGKGVLSVFYESEEVMKYDGNMISGYFDGVGSYQDAMNQLEGYFKEGNFLTTDNKLFENIEKIVVSANDPHSLYVNDGNSNTNLFYYKMIPKGKARGVLTIIPSGGETTENLIKQISLHKEAYEQGLIIIIPSINWGTDDRIPEISFLDTIFKQVVDQHNVSKDNFILCGLSNGGMISLAYGIKAKKESNTYIIPKGIIGLDPPLDYAHFYKYCEREISRNFSPIGVGEAKWFLDNYNTIYEGSPDDYPQNYIEASTFSYGADGGGNAKYLTDIAIRMNSDLNLDYLLNQRQRDLYDWNGTDVVAFINQLKINGNKNAEVIITHNKGVRFDGTVHPHSWSIIDTNDTIEWILELIKE